jgi:hypothetical protein
LRTKNDAGPETHKITQKRRQISEKTLQKTENSAPEPKSTRKLDLDQTGVQVQEEAVSADIHRFGFSQALGDSGCLVNTPADANFILQALTFSSWRRSFLRKAN